jgi:hypothetical protein
MKRLIAGFALCSTLAGAFFIGASSAKVARAELPDIQTESDLIPSPPTTPEMWYYMQEQRRYDDPKQAIRRKAEEKAAQRRDRIAALKWYGMSNSRPTASALPFYGTYSPSWVGNSWNPYHWHGGYGYVYAIDYTGGY